MSLGCAVASNCAGTQFPVHGVAEKCGARVCPTQKWTPIRENVWQANVVIIYDVGDVDTIKSYAFRKSLTLKDARVEIFSKSARVSVEHMEFDPEALDPGGEHAELLGEIEVQAAI